MHFPLMIGLIKSGFCSHVHGFNLMFRYESGDSNIKEIKFSEDIGNIELISDGIAPFLKLLSLRPIG